MNTTLWKTILFLLAAAAFYPAAAKGQSAVAVHPSAALEDGSAGATAEDTLKVGRCEDFVLTGDGANAAWKKAEWGTMTKLDSGGRPYTSRFKILYSGKGIYMLFDGEDEKLSTQSDQDFGKIYEGDAFEVFFHPDAEVPVYFEYEINALNKELILVISRMKDKGYSWAPWQYENKRQQNKRVRVAGGQMEPGSLIRSWTAEVFFPYALLDLLPGNPPQSGSVWRANFCRLDYDSGSMIKWSWSPGIQKSFHELEKFRAIQFE